MPEKNFGLSACLLVPEYLIVRSERGSSMSVPVSESQKNQNWALIGWRGLKVLFAKAISSERSAKLGFGVLFNAEGFKSAPSSFAQLHKADNQSSLSSID